MTDSTSGVAGEAWGMPRHNWNIGGCRDQALVDQAPCKHDVPGFEHLELGFHAQFLDARGHRSQMRRRIDENLFAES